MDTDEESSNVCPLLDYLDGPAGIMFSVGNLSEFRTDMDRALHLDSIHPVPTIYDLVIISAT